jgi:HlyD family secretion protein
MIARPDAVARAGVDHGTPARSPSPATRRTAGVAGGVIAVGIIVGIIFVRDPVQLTVTAGSAASEPSPAYNLAEVVRGPAATRVTAAGTVQPAVSVVVSSQLSGQVQEILVDYNDVVKEGQPIARLDPQSFAFRVEQATAEVDVASDTLRIAKDEVAIAEAVATRAIAESGKAQAEIQRSDAIVFNLSRRLERKLLLMDRGSSPISDIDDARAAQQVAVADASAAKAQVAAQKARLQEALAQMAAARSRVAHAEAEIRRSGASLRQAETELERTVIRAPMDGIIIERSVTAGQTVAASFQAPPLFTIGDLRGVSVEIIVDEADIAGIRIGQPVRFTTDAYPDKIFSATISQVRKAPHTQDGVVTYTVVAAAKNDELQLLPGMTAKAEMTTGERPDALQVPTAALRYRPQGFIQPSGSHVWVFDGQKIHPVAVRVGASSNAGLTEVAGDLVEGGRVAVDGVAESRRFAPTSLQTLRLSLAGWVSQVRSASAGEH